MIADEFLTAVDAIPTIWARIHSTLPSVLTETVEEGLAKGRVEGLVEGLLNALEARFGVVPEGVRDQLNQVSGESRLRQTLRLAIAEPTLDRFLARF